MKWIIDMEAFQINGRWFPKEIAILNPETLKCDCFIVKCDVPYKSLRPEYKSTINFQFARHGIYWDYGKYTLIEVKEIIISMVHSDEVFVKGDEKARFFETWFPLVQQINAPALKNLNKYENEKCNMNHGHCARRKCFELAPYV